MHNYIEFNAGLQKQEIDWSIAKEQFCDYFKRNNNIKKRNKRKFR